MTDNQNNLRLWTPFLAAARRGDLNAVKKEIKKNPNCLSDLSVLGWNGLIAACVGNHIDVVNYLLSLKVFDINQQSKYKPDPSSALNWAATHSDGILFQILINHGATVSSSVLRWAKEYAVTNKNDTCYRLALKFGNN